MFGKKTEADAYSAQYDHIGRVKFVYNLSPGHLEAMRNHIAHPRHLRLKNGIPAAS